MNLESLVLSHLLAVEPTRAWLLLVLPLFLVLKHFLSTCLVPSFVLGTGTTVRNKSQVTGSRATGSAGDF